MPSPLGFDLNPAMIAQMLLEAKRQRMAGDGAKVGAAPFGMPSLPQLAPQSGAPELRAAGTPTSIADYVQRERAAPSALDRAGDVARNYAMAPMDTMDTGTKRLAEAQHEGDWIKGAGGLTQAVAGGASMIPGAAGALYGSIPRSLATSAALGLAPMAAAGMFSGDAEAAGAKQKRDEAATGLSTKQKRALEMERQRLEMLGSAAIAAAKQKRDAARQTLLDAEEEHKRRFGETFSGQHPLASLGMQLGGATLGALLGRNIKMRGATDYTSALNDLSTRAQKATRAAETSIGRAGDPARFRAERMIQQAGGLQEAMDALKKKGPVGGFAPIGLSLAGSEIGSSLPTVIDKQMQGTAPDWIETAKRFGIGTMLGTAAGIFAGKSTPAPRVPHGFGAETEALAASLKARKSLEAAERKRLKTQTLQPPS